MLVSRAFYPTTRSTLRHAPHPLHPHADSRHECDQRDGLQYSYVEHDGRSAAKEVIKDPLNNVQLTIRWVKVAGLQETDGQFRR